MARLPATLDSRFANSLLSFMFFLLLGFASRIPARAQTDPISEQGLKPFGSYDGGNIDVVNLMNGKLDLHVPIVSFPQRGGSLNMDFTLRYDNPIPYVTQICVPPGSGQNCTYQVFFVPKGVQVLSDFNMSLAGYVVNNKNVTTLVLADGSTHELGTLSGTVSESLDDTGFRYDSASDTVTDRKGVQYAGPSSGTISKKDPNGNLITATSSGWTDTLGRTIPAPPGTSTTNFSGCTGTQQTASASTWSIQGFNGGTATYKLCYAAFPVSFSLEGQSFSGSRTWLQSLVLPNNLTWTFEYDSQGNLSTVTLPTGGTISYTWSVGRMCGSSSYPHRFYRALTSRTLNANDGTGSHTWNYQLTGGSIWPNNPPSLTATVTDPAGNDTVHGFTALGQCSFYETGETEYQGSASGGNVLRTTSTTYSYSSDPNAPQDGYTHVNNVLAIETDVSTTTSAGNQVKVVKKTYDSGFTYTGPVGGGTAQYGNVVNEKEYDYGTTNTNGPLLRTTVTQYMALVNSTYQGYNLLDLPSSVQVLDANSNQVSYTAYSYDSGQLGSTTFTQHGPSPYGSYRGNETAVARWLSGSTVSQKPCSVFVSNGNLVSSKAFFDTGEVQTGTDPCNYQTGYTYSSTYQGAYLTTVTNPLQQTTNYGYDFNTGLLTSIQDSNQQTRSMSYDIMSRLTQVSYPDGGSTSFCYTDTGGTCTQGGPPYEVIATKAITSSPSVNEIWTDVFDALGRLSQTQLNSDPSGATYTLTTYDALGRKSQVYNSTHCSPITTNCGETTWGYTTYNYDPLNRITSIIEQDGSTVSTSYSAFPCATVTDEVGNSRESCVDGIGRMTKVLEDPGSSPHLNYETDYTYDALSNLTGVTQNGSNSANARTRTFQYDSLSHLTSASNPESGTIAYAYDADGNLITKTAPLPNQTGSLIVTTTSTYDQLNRLTSKSYKDGSTSDPYTPTVQFGYDGAVLSGCTIAPPGETDSYPVGRRTSMCDGSGATSWAHDTMGRVKQERRAIGAASVSHFIDYSYNLDGSLATLQTPPLKLLVYTYNGAGRPTKLVDSTDGITFVTGATYVPHGEMAGATLGPASNFTGFVLNNAYNDRLQPILLSATNSQTNASVFGECFDFHLGLAITNPSPCSFTASALGNNGNVYQIVNNRDNTRTQSFTYDSLNRIASGQSSGSQWGETFTIDSWSNLTNRAGIAGKTNYESLNCQANSNNQLTTCSLGYDAAGNMTSNGSTSYVYDAENRLVWTSGFRYVYDGNGERVEKCATGSATTACPTSGTNGTLYWKGTGSDPLGETDLGGNTQEEYIFFGGQRVARRDVTSTGTTIAVHYYFSDHLGSHGVVENATGTTCEQDIDYYPYGGQQNDYCAVVSQHYKFTGKERDSESGNDYFGARYYASTMGRFLTPDSARYSGLSDPQSLNLYSYVGNHPTFLIDPDGRCWQWAQKLCDAAHNVGQRFDNLFQGEGFRTDQGVENYAHQHNAERRQQEVNGSTAGRLGQRYGEFHRNWDRWWAAHDCEGSMGGCGLAPSLASLGVYTRPTRTLFRAVSRAEFEDIQKTGKFSASPGGAESKYFYPTLEQAEKMGGRMYGEDYGVVVGNFPESAIEGPTPVATEGDVFTVPNENLELARPAVEVPLEPEIPE